MEYLIQCFTMFRVLSVVKNCYHRLQSCVSCHHSRSKSKLGDVAERRGRKAWPEGVVGRRGRTSCSWLRFLRMVFRNVGLMASLPGFALSSGSKCSASAKIVPVGVLPMCPSFTNKHSEHFRSADLQRVARNCQCPGADCDNCGQCGDVMVV